MSEPTPSFPSTVLDKMSLDLNSDAEAYARKVERLATEPYFREALAKISVSSFVWALYHAFEDDPLTLTTLSQELKNQSAVVERSLISRGTLEA